MMDGSIKNRNKTVIEIPHTIIHISCLQINICKFKPRFFNNKTLSFLPLAISTLSGHYGICSTTLLLWGDIYICVFICVFYVYTSLKSISMQDFELEFNFIWESSCCAYMCMSILFQACFKDSVFYFKAVQLCVITHICVWANRIFQWVCQDMNTHPMGVYILICSTVGVCSTHCAHCVRQKCV